MLMQNRKRFFDCVNFDIVITLDTISLVPAILKKMS